MTVITSLRLYRLLRYAVRAAALVQDVFVCINCGESPRTFPHILHVDTSPHPTPRILHDTLTLTLTLLTLTLTLILFLTLTLTLTLLTLATASRVTRAALRLVRARVLCPKCQNHLTNCTFCIAYLFKKVGVLFCVRVDGK